MAATNPLSLEDECFFIAPIGADDSFERKRSDGVRDFIVGPAVEELGLTVVRADDIAKPGSITHQVIEHVLKAKAAVADLTGANANVYYELAVRHAVSAPVVLIAEKSERLPFDIGQMRTIFFDHQDLASAAKAKELITGQLREALAGAVDSPIGSVIDVEALKQGGDVEQTLAEVLMRLQILSSTVGSLDRYVRRGVAVGRRPLVEHKYGLEGGGQNLQKMRDVMNDLQKEFADANRFSEEVTDEEETDEGESDTV